MIEDAYYLELRKKKAKKIINILSEFRRIKLDFISHLCLDLGSNTGVITAELSECCDHIIGIDLTYELVKSGKVNNVNKTVSFMVGDGLSLPFKSNTFDLVICAQVYEHTRSPTQLFKEIYRVLRPGAICFFSGPNRLWFYEYHYRWYFLHWLPKKILDIYLSTSYGKNFDLNLLNYWQIKKMCSMFEVVDFSLYVAYDLSDVMQEEMMRKFVTALVPRNLAQYLPFLLPNFNWVLVKR
ncbi:MAG: methyltransferase domain-containing protein [Bacteroidales bacterium]